MAEQEMIKHTKKVVDAVTDNKTSWKHKAKDIILEILIIVFAVSLSISLHNWSEKRHDRHEEHAFLEGLRKDLQNDIIEMREDSGSYHWVFNGVKYFTKVANGEALNKDSLSEYVNMFFNTTYFSPNISRFEGLKASGKLSIIENKEILNDMLDLYQENIPFINLLNNYFNTYKMEQLGPVIDRHLDYGKDGKEEGNWEEILRTNELRNGLRRTVAVEEIIEVYGRGIQKAQTLIGRIDKELK